MSGTIAETESIRGSGLVRVLPNGGVFAAELELVVDRHSRSDAPARVVDGFVRAASGGLPHENAMLELHLGGIALTVHAEPTAEPNVASVASV